MVDVGPKDVTDRRAVARALVRMSPATAALVAAGDAPNRYSVYRSANASSSSPGSSNDSA